MYHCQVHVLSFAWSGYRNCNTCRTERRGKWAEQRRGEMITRSCKVSKLKQALGSSKGKLLQQENWKTEQLNKRYKTGMRHTCEVVRSFPVATCTQNVPIVASVGQINAREMFNPCRKAPLTRAFRSSWRIATREVKSIKMNSLTKGHQVIDMYLKLII